MFLSKYGVARHIYIPIIKRAVVDFAVGADWTPVATDVKISKDGGAAANVTNLPVAIVMGNTAMWDFSITATEMQAAQIVIMVVDAATKAVEDQTIEIETYGNASAQHVFDLGIVALDAAAVRAAVGLGSANLDTQLSTIAGYIDTEVAAILAAVDTEIATLLTQTSAASIRTAVGLASANLDTQLSTIAGYIDTEVAAILAAVDTEILAIKAQTDKLTFDAGNHIVADTRKLNTSATAADNLRAGALGVVVSTCAVGSTTTLIATNLTEATDDHYNGRAIIFTSGALAGQASSVSDYTGATKALLVVALTEAPASTDAFVLA